MGACCSSSKAKRPQSNKLAPLYSTHYFGSTIDILHSDISEAIRADVIILFTIKAQTIISISYPNAKKDLKKAISDKLQHNDLILANSSHDFFKKVIFIVIQQPTDQELQDGLIHALNLCIENKFSLVAVPDILYEFTLVKPNRYSSIVMNGLAYCCEEDSGLNKIKLVYKDEQNAKLMKDEFGGDLEEVGNETGNQKSATPRKVKIEISDDDYHVGRMSEYTKKKASMHSRNASAAANRYASNPVKAVKRYKFIRNYSLLKNNASVYRIRSKIPTYKLNPTYVHTSDVINPKISRTPWVNSFIPLRTIKPGLIKKYIKKSNWSATKTFSLYISPQDISDDFFKVIKVAMIRMMSLKTLRQLEIELDLAIISDEVVILVLQKLVSLQKLTLKSTSTIDDGGLAELSRKLVGFTKLQTLDLQLRGYIIPIGYWLKVLGESLPTLNKFQTLKLSLELIVTESYTEKNMFNNLVGLKNLDQIPELELNLTIVNYASGPNSEALLQVLKSLKNLTKLLLEFTYSAIDAPLIMAVASVVQMLPKITHFSFLSEECENLSPNSFAKFADAIRQVSRLTSFRFYLQTNGIVNTEIPLKISESLSKLFNFQNLDLSLSQGNFQANFLQTFINFSNLKLLQTFKIDFLKGNKISDNILSVLSKALTQFIQAADISLNLSGCEGITDTALVSLGTNLPLNLKRLNLNLSSITTFTDEGFQDFMKKLQTLMYLRTLELDCSRCGTIASVGTQALANCILKLKNLDNVTLSLAGCQLVDDIGLERIGDALANMKFLNELYLNVSGCELLTKNGIFMFGATLIGARALRRADLRFKIKNFLVMDEGNLLALLERAPNLMVCTLKD